MTLSLRLRLRHSYLALQLLLASSLLGQALHQLLGLFLQHGGVLTGGAERGKQTDDKIRSRLLLLVQSHAKILGYDIVRSGMKLFANHNNNIPLYKY